MKFVIDSNIVFSAILHTESRIGQLIHLGSNKFEYYSIFQLKEEILNHKSKILSLTEYSEDQFSSIYDSIVSRIRFIDIDLISDQVLHEALILVSDIDENDALFVALGMHLDAKIWSGDRKLSIGLRKKGYDGVVSTEDLYKAFLK